VSVEMGIYVPLSVMMFLEYAIWGAWAPVLAARLLGPLKMSGKQTGWIYATLPVGCIISPLIAGQLADQWLNTEWILAGAHLIGAALLFVAAKQGKFATLFAAMMCFSLCYGATLPLVNKLLFFHVDDVETQGKVFIWAPVAWALAGYVLTGWRLTRKTESDGSDCLVLAALLSLVMGICCFFVPATPPEATGEVPVVQAMSMLGDLNFLFFIVLSMVIFGLMQFYFLGTAHFMQEMGIASKNVPASMAIAQAAQAAATWFLLSICLASLGFKWTLIAGALSWLVMYLVYIGTKPPWLIVCSQALHGLAYVLFVIVGQIYANTVAPPEIRGSIQALVFMATAGIGLFFGTQFAGIVMDHFSVEGKFQWRKIWMVSGGIMLAGMLVLAAAFHDPPDEEKTPKETPEESAETACRDWHSPAIARVDHSARNSTRNKSY